MVVLHTLKVRVLEGAQVDVIEGEVTAVATLQRVVPQPLVVAAFQLEPIGVAQLHVRKVVAVVHHHVELLMKQEDLVYDVEELAGLLPRQPVLVVSVQVLCYI